VINAVHLPLEQHVLVTAQNARITLDHGFTSANSAGTLGERIEPALRDMINAGFLPGPRLRASALEKGAEGVMGVPEGHDPTHDRSKERVPVVLKDGLIHRCATQVRHDVALFTDWATEAELGGIVARLA
jgi:hypothetical protein